jgi:hypothetical protein
MILTLSFNFIIQLQNFMRGIPWTTMSLCAIRHVILILLISSNIDYSRFDKYLSQPNNTLRTFQIFYKIR